MPVIYAFDCYHVLSPTFADRAQSEDNSNALSATLRRHSSTASYLTDTPLDFTLFPLLSENERMMTDNSYMEYWTASILIPGWGQFCQGRFKKGIFWFAGTIGGWWAIAWWWGVAVWLFNIHDAYTFRHLDYANPK